MFYSRLAFGPAVGVFGRLRGSLGGTESVGDTRFVPKRAPSSF